jgi:hypothetical protein
MGARGANFHFEVFARMGYEAEALHIQDLYLAGKKQEAAAAVPLSMVEDVALVGPVDKIRDELARWKETCLTTMLVSGPAEVLRTELSWMSGRRLSSNSWATTAQAATLEPLTNTPGRGPRPAGRRPRCRQVGSTAMSPMSSSAIARCSGRDVSSA